MQNNNKKNSKLNKIHAISTAVILKVLFFQQTGALTVMNQSITVYSNTASHIFFNIQVRHHATTDSVLKTKSLNKTLQKSLEMQPM